jgi:mannose-6-phosphate isomerase-like protein (cupin superfamily)
MVAVDGLYGCGHESDSALLPHQAPRPALAAVELDENSERGLYLERTDSENLGARLWRLPPKSANTLHKHVRSEEFYFVLEGTGRMRVGHETVTVPKYGGVLVGPNQLRQVFNDTDEEVLWLIIGAPEELELLQGSKSKMDLSLIYPVEPTQLPKELAGIDWPPKT